MIFLKKESLSVEKIKLSIICYSSTGTNYQLAQWAKEEAGANGAEVRLRKVKELAPEFAIEQNPAWKKHYDATHDVEEAVRHQVTRTLDVAAHIVNGKN